MMSRERAMSNGGIPPIKETIGTRRWRARRATARYLGQTIGSTLAMSAAFAIASLVTSHVRSGSPWAGLNGMAVAAGVGRRRARGRFESSTTLAGLGVLAAGVLAVAAVYQGIRRAR